MTTSYSFPPKYGVRFGGNSSGYSPVGRVFPRKQEEFSQEEIDASVREEYQRDKLYAFTTQELMDLDAITGRTLEASNLPDIIHPIFERKNWLTGPRANTKPASMPPGYPGNGLWTVENDEIWNAVLPSIKIISMLLKRLPEMPWFTALFADKIPGTTQKFRESVAPDRLRAVDKFKLHFNIHEDGPQVVADDYFTFECQVPVTKALQEETQKALDKIFAALEVNYQVSIGIKHPTKDPWDSAVSVHSSGVSVMTGDTAWMFYSYTLIAALLRGDLTDCERKGLEYQLSSVMFHELVHIMFNVHMRINKIDYPKDMVYPEPFYGMDPLSELGFSAEYAAFHAYLAPMINRNSPFISPLGFWIEKDFPTLKWVPKCEGVILTSPQLDPINMVFPVKATTVEEIQLEEFWQVGIDTFGLEILHTRSLCQGSKVTYRGLSSFNQVDRAILAGDADLERATRPVERLQRYRERVQNLTMTSVLNMTPHQRKLVEFGLRVVRNNIWEEEFWKQNEDLSIYIEDMLPTITYVFNHADPQPTIDSLTQFATFLEKTRTLHQAAIDTLLMLENTAPDRQHTTRRVNLLNYNRGARLYAAELFAIAQDASADPSTLTTFRDEIFGLEFANLLLYDSSVTYSIPSLLAEHESLSQAYMAVESGVKNPGDLSHYQSAFTLLEPYLVDPPDGESTLCARTCAMSMMSLFPEQLLLHADGGAHSHSLEMALQYAEGTQDILLAFAAYVGNMKGIVRNRNEDLFKRYETCLEEHEKAMVGYWEKADQSIQRLLGEIAARIAADVWG